MSKSLGRPRILALRPLIGVWAALFGLAASAQALTPAGRFDLEQLELNPSGVGALSVGSARLLPAWTGRGGVAYHYEKNPLTLLGEDGRSSQLVRDRLTLHAMGAFSLGDRVELSASVPFVAHQEGQDLRRQGFAPVQRGGLGTPYLGVRAAILQSSSSLPLNVVAQVSAGLPVGQRDAIAGDARVAFLPKLIAGTTFAGFEANVEVGGLLRERSEVGTQALGNQLRFAAALATTGDTFRGEIAYRGALALGAQSAQSPPIGSELLAGGRFAFSRYAELFLLGGPGFGGGPGTPQLRVLGGLAFHPGEKVELGVVTCMPGLPHDPSVCPLLDLDDDGLRNDQDACVSEPEDRDGIQDEDGCPETDADGDGTLDEEDRCPLVSGLSANRGCPISDQDSDGVADADDACPAEPGPVERKGCPFKDADGDGIEDGEDACPSEAGKLEQRGCPIVDTDGDTVPDTLDNCPKEKGEADNQGCPKARKQLVIITRERLEIREKVFFATGKAKILPRSFALLDQVASVVREHPEIPLVAIEGHTDDRGTAKLNRRLSQSRADAVRDYLVKRGVDAARLTSKGFGPDRPAGPNTSESGRENNRRVEFNLPQLPTAADSTP